MKEYNLPGFRDFYPQDLLIRNYISSKMREKALIYGFEEWDGPVLEPVDIYKIKSGDEIVSQLFHFKDQGNREVSLRPEMTPSLVRMFSQNIRNFSLPAKWFSISNCFRTERQQRGRLREFYQLNVDILGEEEGLSDAEVIALSIDTLLSYGLTLNNFIVKINHREIVNSFFKSINIPDELYVKIYSVIDKSTKIPHEETERELLKLNLNYKSLQNLLEYLQINSFQIANAFFDKLGIIEIERLMKIYCYLKDYGFDSCVKFDPSIVRGLAYYTGCVFEIFSTDVDNVQRAICGGGRYDNLFTLFGGKTLPSCGFGMGDVVIELLLREKNLIPKLVNELDYYITSIGNVPNNVVINIVNYLRNNKLKVDFSFKQSKLSKQLKRADKLNSKHVVIIGEEELANDNLKIKNMKTGEENIINIYDFFKRKSNK